MIGSLRYYDLAKTVIEKRFRGVEALADFEDRERMLDAVAAAYTPGLPDTENSDNIEKAINEALAVAGPATRRSEQEDMGEIYRLIVVWSVDGREYGTDTHYVTCNDTGAFETVAGLLAEKSHWNDPKVVARKFAWSAENIWLGDLDVKETVAIFNSVTGTGLKHEGDVRVSDILGIPQKED